jgi:hypothetical protein
VGSALLYEVAMAGQASVVNPATMVLIGAGLALRAACCSASASACRRRPGARYASRRGVQANLLGEATKPAGGSAHPSGRAGPTRGRVPRRLSRGTVTCRPPGVRRDRAGRRGTGRPPCRTRAAGVPVAPHRGRSKASSRARGTHARSPSSLDAGGVPSNELHEEHEAEPSRRPCRSRAMTPCRAAHRQDSDPALLPDLPADGGDVRPLDLAPESVVLPDARRPGGRHGGSAAPAARRATGS